MQLCPDHSDLETIPPHREADMGASGSLIEPPSQPVVKIVEAIYKANCNIKMNSIMIPPPPL